MLLSGIPVRVVGGIDLCVRSFYRSHGIRSELLKRVEVFALRSNSDFIILFADDDRIYAKHGYQHTDNPCRWLRINEHATLGVAEEPVDDALMYKRIGAINWRLGVLALLGYLY
jgi:GNAT superfamily N-acetyltransferase